MVAHKAWKTLSAFTRHPIRHLSQASLSKKLWLSFNLLLLILFAGSWVAWWHIRQIQNHVTDLVTVAEPLKVAALNMEINATETAEAVYQYLRYPEPSHKLRFDDAREDFRILQARFAQLASTDQLTQIMMATQFNQKYLSFCDLGEEMMDSAEKKHDTLNKLRKIAIQLDEVIDEKPPKQIKKSNPNATTKLEAALDMEINIHEALISIESYAAKSDPNLLARYHDAQADFQNAKRMYQQTNPSTRELEWLNRINDLFTEATQSGNAIIKHIDKLKNLGEKFTRDLERIDDTFDNEIHPSLYTQALKAARDSTAAAHEAAVILILLAALGFLVAVTSALTISRQIVRPVKELVKGTKIIAQNNLDHRIQVRSSDEFGLLADAFNQMVVNLKRTRQKLVHHHHQLTLEINEHKQAEEALRKSEDKYRGLFENAIDMIHIVDEQYRIVDINETELRKLGYSRSELIGKPLMTIVHPDFRPITQDGIPKVRSGHAISSYDTALITKDGDTIFVAANAVPIMREGKFCGAQAILHDITERKQAEDILRQTQRTNQLILQAIPDMILCVSRNGIYKEVHRVKGFEPIWGKQNVLGKHLADVLPADLADQFLTAIEQTFSSQKLRSLEYTLHIHGQKRWRESRIIPFTNDQVIVMIRDITKRKKDEQTLRQSEARLRNAERIAGLGHWDWNCLTHELHLSDEIYRMFDLYPKLDKSDYKLFTGRFHPDDRHNVENYFQAHLEQSKNLDIQFRILLPDKTIRYIHPKGKVTRDKHGNPIRFFGTVLDVTEQKLAEKQIHEYQEKLRALTSELSLSEERQRRKFAALLHDHIGPLLAVSKMKLAPLRQNPQSIDNAELEEIHNFLDQAIDYTRSLTVELSPPVLYEFGLDAAIEELLENTQKTHHIQVHFDHDQLEKPLEPDAKIVLFQAVRELIHNVAKHAHAKHINVSSKKNHDHIEITIQDDGVGFDPDHLHSPDNHKKAFGLFHIKERLDMLDGSVLIDTQPGQGTRVRLQTPLAHKTGQPS